MLYSFDNNISVLDSIFCVITDFCMANRIPRHTVCELKIIVDELVSNVINYNFSVNNSKILMSIVKKNSDLKLTIADSGEGFNPLLRQNPDVTIPLENRQLGGLGIFLVKKLSKKIHYKRKNLKNILTVVLQIK